MNKKGHWIFAAILCLLFIVLVSVFDLKWFSFSFFSILGMIAIIGFYSLLPDVDHKAGTMTWVFLGIGLLGLVNAVLMLIFDYGIGMGLLIGSTTLLVATFISAHWLPHRGFIHTVQVGILSVIPLWYIFHSFAYCVLAYVAWHSHLIGDGYIFKVR